MRNGKRRTAVLWGICLLLAIVATITFLTRRGREHVRGHAEDAGRPHSQATAGAPSEARRSLLGKSRDHWPTSDPAPTDAEGRSAPPGGAEKVRDLSGPKEPTEGRSPSESLRAERSSGDAVIAQGRSIVGTVFYDGSRLPRNKPIDPGRDFCSKVMGSNPLTRDYVINRGRFVQNAVVYVTNPPDKARDATKGPPIRFEKCRIDPPVVGFMGGQVLSVENKDETLHNFRVEGFINHALPRPSARTTFTLRPTLANPIPREARCDVHPWEKAYLYELSHSYFAITDELGAFRIDGLEPDERYDVRVWHAGFRPNYRKVIEATTDGVTKIDFFYRPEDVIRDLASKDPADGSDSEQHRNGR